MGATRRGTTGNDRINGSAGADIILGLAGNDLLYGMAGHDRLFGGIGNDSLFGGSGNDTLDGGSGVDILRAGSGNDTLVFTLAHNASPGAGPDIYDGGTGNDTLQLNLTATEWSNAAVKAQIQQFAAAIGLAAGGPVNFNFTALGLKVTSIEKLELYIDGQLVDLSRQVVDLSGSTADETVVVTGSSSLVTTGTGNDTIVGGAGDDTISSGGGNDHITLGDGNDVVFAGSGNDVIVAGHGGGDDYIDAGSGNDTVRYDSAVSGINVDLRTQDRSSVLLLTHPTLNTVGDLLVANGQPATLPIGLATGTDISVDVLIGVENIVLGQGNDTAAGDDLNNRLDGAGGDDLIDGQAGSDDLIGGQGSDTLNGGADDDTLTGGAGDDTIDGDGGYDRIVLSGNLSDYVFQTLGNGFYSVTDQRAGGDGVDIIREIEEVVFADTTQGLWNLVGILDVFGDPNPNLLAGTDARERFYGFDGNDTILGGLEEDFFIGGRGNDTFDGGGPEDDFNFVLDGVLYDSDYDLAVQAGFAASGVVVNLATGTATDVYGDTDTLIDIERVWGTRLGDNITGSDASEFFDPNGGNDTIDGGAGRDSLNYHLVDGYYGAGTTTGITVQFSATIAGSGTVIDPLGDTDIFSGIEIVRGTRYADQFTGGLGQQAFMGLDGSDVFDGGADSDRVRYDQDSNYGGMAGISFDLSVTDASGFATLIDAFGAQDKLRGIEDVSGTGAADVMRGDAADNIFEGNSGNDSLSGAAGVDDLLGGLGDDTLDGGIGADALFGEIGADVLTGGVGDDYMEGGLDADQFVFAAGDGADWINDFEVGLDRLILTGGQTIGSLAESDVDGDGGLDTTVLFASGDQVVLWSVSGVTDPNSLL